MADDDGTRATGGEGGSGSSGSTGGSGGTSLDALLAKLDDDGRKAVRAELERARADAAKYRTRAAKFGDLDPERAKAALAKLDEIEQQGKTEAQQAQERAAAAEKERDTARTELLRERIGRRHGLSETFTALLQGTDEESMNEHAERLAAELGEARKRPGDAVPSTVKPEHAPGAHNSETHAGLTGRALIRAAYEETERTRT